MRDCRAGDVGRAANRARINRYSSCPARSHRKDDMGMRGLSAHPTSGHYNIHYSKTMVLFWASVEDAGPEWNQRLAYVSFCILSKMPDTWCYSGYNFRFDGISKSRAATVRCHVRNVRQPPLHDCGFNDFYRKAPQTLTDVSPREERIAVFV